MNPLKAEPLWQAIERRTQMIAGLRRHPPVRLRVHLPFPRKSGAHRRRQRWNQVHEGLQRRFAAIYDLPLKQRPRALARLRAQLLRAEERRSPHENLDLRLLQLHTQRLRTVREQTAHARWTHRPRTRGWQRALITSYRLTRSLLSDLGAWLWHPMIDLRPTHSGK